MRPGAFRLFFAAAMLGLVAASPQIADAAPAGTRPGAAGPSFGLSGLRPGPVGLSRYPGRRGYLYRAGARFGQHPFRGRGGRHGYGYGAFYGLPIGYGFGPWADDGAPIVVEQPAVKPEWPTSIGIPPSPVQPPAIYVIGEPRRGAARAVKGRRVSGVRVTDGSSRLASAPRFITVPSGR